MSANSENTYSVGYAIFAVSSKKLDFILVISGVIGPIFIKFAQNVAKILSLYILKS